MKYKAIPNLGLHIAGVLRLGMLPFTHQFYRVAAPKPVLSEPVVSLPNPVEGTKALGMVFPLVKHIRKTRPKHAFKEA